MSEGFVIYPGIDDEFGFPPEIRQALANSPEIIGKISTMGAGKISDTQKGVAGGVAQLDSGTKIPLGLIPDLVSLYVARGKIVISVKDYYPSGYVAGTTDIKSAFDAAVAAAPEGATVQFESGYTHFGTSFAPITKSLTIDGNGCSLTVDPTPGSGTAGTPVFYFVGTISSSPNSIFTPAVNSTTVTTVTTSDAANYAVGDHVIISDNLQVRPWDYGGAGATPTYPEGYYGREEITTVKSVNTSTGVITLMKPIEFAYSASPVITKITKMLQAPEVRNFAKIHEIDPGGLNTATPDYGPNVPHIIHMQYCHTPRTDRIHFDGFNRHCVNYHRCINPQFRHLWAKNPFQAANGGHGYLGRIDRSMGGHMESCYSEGVRHHLDHVMNVDATSANNIALAPVSCAYILHGLQAKRIKSFSDKVYDAGSAWGWCSGNLAFGPDFDFTIINPTYTGTSNAIVFHATAQRMTIINPSLHSTSRVLLMTTGAADLRVAMGEIEVVGNSNIANSILCRSKASLSDAYGLTPGSVRWSNVRLRGVNPAMSIDSGGTVEVIDCTFDEVDESVVGSGVNLIQLVTTPASLRIAGVRGVGIFSNGIYNPNTAPAGQYSIEFNHFKGVTTGRAVVTPAASNLKFVGNRSENNGSGLSPWNITGDLVAAKVGSAGYGATVIGNSPATLDELTLMGLTVNGPIAANAGQVTITGAAGTNRSLTINDAASGTSRWILRGTNLAETGSNAGTDIELVSRDDSGALVAQIMIAKRVGDSIWGASGKKLGFYGSSGATKPTVTGSRGTESAPAASLRAALVSLGLITDSTTA